MKTSLQFLLLILSLGAAVLARPLQAGIVVGGPYSAQYACDNPFGPPTIMAVAWSHTVQASSERLLVVSVVTPLANVARVEFNALPLTQKAAAVNDVVDPSVNATGVQTEVWYLVNPPVGTFPVVVNLSSPVHSVGAIAAQYRNVNQTTPLGDAVITVAGPPATSVSSNVPGTVSTPNQRGMVIDAVGLERQAPMGSWSAGENQTHRGFQNVCGVMGLAISEELSNCGTVTMSGVSDPVVVEYAIAQVAVEVKPAPGNVTWAFPDSVAACPAGDTLLFSHSPSHPHPSRLRVLVTYLNGSLNPRVGVPPESIWIAPTATTGNLRVNDKAATIVADDSTNSAGQTRVTIPSFSGCGTLTFRLFVSGVDQGTCTALIRTADTDADGRVGSADQSAACDINYNGTADDATIVVAHVDHWRRHALHGTLVKRTALCDTCLGGPNTVSAEGRISWQPSGRRIVYAIHEPVSAICNLYIVPSDPAGGNTPRKFTFRDSSDYDPSWSPLGHEIVFYRQDRKIYRKGVPGFAPDTSEIGIYEEPSPNFITSTAVSPDGDNVAFGRLVILPTSHRLYTIPIIGGEPRQISNLTGVEDINPYWSPKGKLLFFQRLGGGRSDLYKVSTQGPASAGELYFKAENPNQDAVSPSIAPDSLVVLCGLGPTGPNPRKTAVLETAAPVSTIKAITSNYPTHQHNALDPILSPDGTRLALLAWDPAVPPPGANAPQVFAARRNMNLPPQFTTIGSHAVADSSTTVSDAPTVGQNFSFTVTAVDPEGDPLSYDAYFLQEGMTFTPGTRTFSWTPPPATVGKTFKVKFIVTTSSGGTDVIIDKLTVQPCCAPQARAVQTDPPSEAVQTGATSEEGPNPTTGRFSLATPRIAGVRAELAVFDQSGRRVALVGGPSGSPLVWEGTGSEGRRLPSGVYWYRLRVGDYEKRGRIVLLR